MDRQIYRLIESELLDLRSDVYALGGTQDHVHALVTLRAVLSVASLVKQVKGTSSRFMTDHIEGFRWQPGYGAFSVSRNHVERVKGYVLNQKKHHANNDIYPAWEPS